MKQQYHIGIDLGTTFSSLAYVDQGSVVQTLRLPNGRFQMASAIYFKNPSEIVVGDEALEFAFVDASRVARAFKRQMGDQTYMQKGSDGTSTPFEPDGKQFRPEELSAMVLRKLLAAAEEKLGPIDRATISVPFVFDEKRRQATIDAGRIAGLTEVEIVDEPVAAAIAYGHMLVQKGGFERMGDVYLDQEVLVYDLGGGTFDATLMKLRRDNTFEVLGTHGDERLGGEDWDNVLLDMIVEHYQALTNQDPRGNTELLQELRLKATAAKETLSAAKQVEISFPIDGQERTCVITRPDFIQKTKHLIARTQATLEEMLERCGRNWSHIDRVLMVGGSSRMPSVFLMLEKCTNRPLDRSLSPDTAIAMGAALFGALRAGEKGLPVEGVITVNSHPLGLMVRSRQTRGVFNDVLLKANQPTEFAVTRTYGVQPGMKSLTLAILLGDARDPQACTNLGRGTIPSLPPDLKPDDHIDVKFCFLKNGLLNVEGVVRRTEGPPLQLQFDIQVEGTMTEAEVDAARITLMGVQIE